MKTPIALQLMNEELATELEILKKWNREPTSSNAVREQINNKMRQIHSKRIQELESEIKFLKSINPIKQNEHKHTSITERSGLSASGRK